MPNLREAAQALLDAEDARSLVNRRSHPQTWANLNEDYDKALEALRAALEAETDRVSVPVGWQFRYVCGEDGYGPWQFTSDEHDASVYENNVSYETRRVYSLAAHERSRDGS